MIRVRNEEQFLEASVRSIAPFVDEIVIVDNLSDDRTPEIIARLSGAYPAKVKSFVYPHRLARYGEENLSLASTQEGLKSPALLANFYNWCLSLCTHPFVLKWDGDTVATAGLAEMLSRFRRGSYQSVWHTGANLHENGTHLIADRPYEDVEPRLFLKRFARYDNALGYCEALQSPYLHADRYAMHYSEPAYVHMKFCKSDRFSNMSENLQRREQQINRPGPLAEKSILDAVNNWHLIVLSAP